MKVGFLTHHGPNEPTVMSAAIGSRVSDLGYAVDVFSRTQPIPVDPNWDKRIVVGLDPVTWIKTAAMSHLVFAEPPDPAWIAAAIKAETKTLLLLSWDRIDQEGLQSIANVNTVLCPTSATFAHASSRLQLTNHALMPWDPCIPVTRDDRDLDAHAIRIVWQVDERFPFGDHGFIAVIHRVLSDCPVVKFVIVYPNAIQLVKPVRRLLKDHPDRVEIVTGSTWDRQRLAIGRSDLAICPSLLTSGGAEILTALYMGTPVVAFRHPIADEVVRDGINGTLVTCQFGHTWAGVPVVVPDYGLMAEAVINIVRDPARLVSLRKRTAWNLTERRRQFSSAIDRLFL